jgi:hypothetical protein
MYSSLCNSTRIPNGGELPPCQNPETPLCPYTLYPVLPLVYEITTTYLPTPPTRNPSARLCYLVYASTRPILYYTTLRLTCRSDATANQNIHGASGQQDTISSIHSRGHSPPALHRDYTYLVPRRVAVGLTRPYASTISRTDLIHPPTLPFLIEHRTHYAGAA